VARVRLPLLSMKLVPGRDRTAWDEPLCAGPDEIAIPPNLISVPAISVGVNANWVNAGAL
jgi:hypothetical protein